MAEIYDFFQQQLERSEGNPSASEDRPANYTDEALALRFTAQHGQDLRYVRLWGQWLGWNGKRWQPDDTLQLTTLQFSNRIG